MKRPILYSLGAVALLAAAFFTGRYTVPTKVETRVETLTYTQVQTKVIRQVVTDTKWKTVVVTKPDGSSVSTTEGETHSKDNSTVNSNSSTTAKDAKLALTETRRPDWQISALVGTNILNALNGSGLTPTFGIHVQRRVLGPLTIGVFGSTSGVFMGSVGVQF